MTRTPKLSAFNPNEWADPDEIGSSEYRAIHEHALAVWDSNRGEKTSDRAQYVKDSLIEMRDDLDRIISTGPPQGELSHERVSNSNRKD